jgi:phage gp36-like protein
MNAHTYASPDDMVTMFGEPHMRALTDIDQVAAGQVVTERLQRALETATGEVDGYMVGRYALPLATVPSTVRTHVICLARYHLMGAHPDDKAMADRKAAISFFEKVAIGTLPLFAPSQVVAPSGGGDGAQMQSGSSVFAREGGW